MRIVFDLDNTLCDSSKGYAQATPIPGMVQFLKELHQEGHTIIIHTARGMGRNDGNEGLALAGQGALTFKQLELWDIPYDEIYFGKPAGDIYVDDKAVNTYDLLEEINGVLTI